MRFVVTECFYTGDKSRFGITGYLTVSDDSEMPLLREILKTQYEMLEKSKESRNTFKVFPSNLKICKVSIDSCKLILDMYRKNFGVAVDVVLDDRIVIVPKKNTGLAKVELRRLNA